jgi:heme-degrading monooxygenase HmoA
MPVLMTLHAHGDVAALEQRAAADPGGMQAIADKAKAHGCRSHRFYGADDGSMMVVDEWESPEAFNAFFEASPEIQVMMREIGVTEQPEVTFWRELDTHDAF